LILFHLLDVGTAWAFALGLCVTMAIVGTIYGPVGAYVPELFATRHRYSGAGIAYSLAGILGGSIPPLLATWLIENYGNQSIGYYLAAMGALSVICVLALRNSRPGAMSEHTEHTDRSSAKERS
jgi:MFS family permease